MEKKYNVVFFIGSLTGGGAERVTCNLANYLYDKGYNVSLITMSDIKDTYILNKNIKRFYLLKNNERKNVIHNYLIRFKRLKKYLIDNKNVDCYVTMLPITIYMLLRLKKYTDAKIIISERNNPKTYRFYEKLITRYSENKCDGLVVQTNQIGEWYKTNNKVVIPNAINKNIDIKDLKDKKDREKRIVAVGRLEEQKNYPMLIRAFSIFSKKHPEYILDIYGKGSLQSKLQDMCKKYNIDDKVFFKGYVENISKEIYNAKAFVMTSNFEGMPNALIEAMCIGLPCISTDCDGGGAKDLIDNNSNGILINKNNDIELVNAMEKILDDDFSNLISKNSKTLAKRLSYDKIYGEWEKYIRKIVRK